MPKIISRQAIRKWRSSSTWSRPEITEALRHSLKWPGAIRTALVWKKTKKMRSCGTANLQNKAMQWHNVILAIAIIVEKALKKTLERRLSGIANLRSKEMQQLNVTLQYSIKMDMV